MGSEEMALVIKNLQNLQEERHRGKHDEYPFALEGNYRRKTTLYKVKKFVQTWMHRFYFSLVPESQDPRWIPGNYTITYCKSPPMAMIILAILAIISYLIDDCRGLLANTRKPNSIASYLVYNPHRRYQLWRYLTPLLVHTGLPHLGVNLICQIRFGVPLEVAHRWWRVLLVYLTGVLAGTLASSVASPQARLAGASAGVFSLITFDLISLIVVHYR
ncbi:rhomboid-related protein 3-like isoform X3 [Agrilus planipennis]|uniref:Rhomboid-related protein 3-like isoform X3 n=1 Tax=Agrilus planipennis TaxID=224129 RepID=A0A1W4X1U9_AGRPL|nr:rhomboid-related protein 3-like isoform X3 [Agrilus planipennis]